MVRVSWHWLAVSLTLTLPARAQEVNDLALMMRQMGGAGLTGKTLDRAIKAAAAHPLGAKENPVRADGPEGEQAYLNHLRCPNGAPPAYEREGNVGVGVYGYIVDAYAVKCADAPAVTLFMDMYHRHEEQAPVPGFTIAQSAPAI